MKTALLTLLCCLPAVAQTPGASQPMPPSYANYSLMLVSPAPNGGAVVLMHNPKNAIEFVPVANTKQALDAGYVAVRATELDELIGALREENARLTAENAQLKGAQPKEASAPPALPPNHFEAEYQERLDRDERRQRLIQAWVQMQSVSRPYQLPAPVNPNAGRLRTNCVTTNLGTTSTTNCN